MLRCVYGFLCVCFCIYSVWCLLSVTDFGKFWPLFLPIFLLCCFFFFFWYFIYAHVILFGIVLSSWMFCSAFFILFLCVPVCLSSIALFFFRWNGILIILCPTFNFNDFFSLSCQVYDEPAEGILYVFCFWFLAFPFDTFLQHPSLC